MNVPHLRGLTLCLLLACAAPAPAEDSLDDKVKKAVNDGVRFLRDQEAGKGNFEHTALIAQTRPGGVTSLAVVALLKAGVPANDPLIQRCLKYLRKLPPEQTYVVGLQTMAFCLAGQKEDREQVQRNLDWLKKTQSPDGWGYTAKSQSSDHSINRYALLGIHEAWKAGFAIGKDVTKDFKKLRALHAHYEGNKEGQWAYRSARHPTLTMTTAGLCNLIATGQVLREMKPLRANGADPTCGAYDDAGTVRNALKWVGESFPSDIQAAKDFVHPFYCLHGIGHLGELTGQRFLGEHDWYRIGCEHLVATQRKDGSWEGSGGFDPWPTVATSFAVIFLVEGRKPVLIAKFAHGRDGGAIQEWNRKRNDARHVVEFARRELFGNRPMAWQAFDPREVPPPLGKRPGKSAKELTEGLLQARMVYITGHKLENIIGQREEEILKEYLANGGFIFAEACCNSPQFDRQFRQLMKRVTGKDLAPLPNNHPVWAASGKLKVPPGSFGLEGIDIGNRTAVIYSPRAISSWWEDNDHKSERGKLAFHTAANVIAYVAAKKKPKP